MRHPGLAAALMLFVGIGVALPGMAQDAEWSTRQKIAAGKPNAWHVAIQRAQRERQEIALGLLDAAQAADRRNDERIAATLFASEVEANVGLRFCAETSLSP